MPTLEFTESLLSLVTEVKGKPLTKEETKALLEFIELSKVINNKTTNATNNKLKAQEWDRIAKRFNATAAICRQTPQQLRLKWENLKKNARKRCTRIRMNSLQTGGGRGDYIPPNDILDRVSSLLGSTASGFDMPYGGDRAPFVISGDGNLIGDGDCDDESFNIGGNANINIEIFDHAPMDMKTVGGGMVLDVTNPVQEAPIAALEKPKHILFPKKSGNGYLLCYSGLVIKCFDKLSNKS